MTDDRIFNTSFLRQWQPAMIIDARFLEKLSEFLHERRSDALRVLHHLTSDGREFLDLSRLRDVYCTMAGIDSELLNSPLGPLLERSQVAVVDGSWICFGIRRRIGRWAFLRLHLETLDVEEVSTRTFLRFKEHAARQAGDDRILSLEIDLEPFERGFPKLQEAGSIGQGAQYLNRRLSGQLFNELDEGAHRLLEFLRVHKYQGQQLLIGKSITDLSTLRSALRSATSVLSGVDPATPWSELEMELLPIGFEVGWGKDAARACETMEMLLELLEAPSPSRFEAFLARIPMIFTVAILSPHGYFGQSGVLGLPDTGGQVVYILDQVRALETEMRQRLELQGLAAIEPQIVVLTRLIPNAGETTCNERLEPIAGTRHARILRIPFRDENGEILTDWVSRFEVWPYLEQYALDAETELLAELGGRPDLVIGNYSDGNLVASLIGHRMGVTQCTIAHALEKSKYANSDLFWRDEDDQYHFSCQFTADLIAMNAADFIITSTYQEIAGTESTMGQYEGYSFFTMPGLYRVMHGIDIYDPKFNIVSPGADPEVYFPASEDSRRLKHLHGEIHELLYGDGAGSQFRGKLEDESKPLIFTLARMDRIKNVSGLLEMFGNCEDLRNEANLLIASGFIDPALSKDTEERAEIERMHEIFDSLELDGSVRWVEAQVHRERNGELYRVVADSRGAFAQPATFEAFGLTVIESMSTGLPTFATCFGGPLEIIEEGKSGFHIDPHHGDTSAQKMADFFKRCRKDPKVWDEISKGALDRVEAKYTWKGYAERLMTLSRIYGFWRHVSDLERRETKRYLEMLYALQFRPLANALRKGPSK